MSDVADCADRLNIREQLDRRDLARAETQKLLAEMTKLNAEAARFQHEQVRSNAEAAKFGGEQAQLAAEAAKLSTGRAWLPWQVVATGLTAAAAVAGATAALVTVLGK